MLPDQAHGLRRLFTHRAARMLGVVGEDAAGLVVELARAFAALSLRVLIVDRTCGEVARALGLKARYELRHALAGDRTLAQVALDGPDGIVVLPAARALAELDAATPADAQAACEHIDAALGPFDLMLVNGVPLALPDAGVLLTLSPTSAALTLAYTELKRLSRKGHPRRCEIVIQNARTEAAAMDAFDSVALTAGRFLGMTLALAGTLPAAPAHAGTTDSPRSRATLCVAERLVTEPVPGRRAVNH